MAGESPSPRSSGAAPSTSGAQHGEESGLLDLEALSPRTRAAAAMRRSHSTSEVRSRCRRRLRVCACTHPLFVPHSWAAVWVDVLAGGTCVLNICESSLRCRLRSPFSPATSPDASCPAGERRQQRRQLAHAALPASRGCVCCSSVAQPHNRATNISGWSAAAIASAAAPHLTALPRTPASPAAPCCCPSR